jgi:hypothetical protein
MMLRHVACWVAISCVCGRAPVRAQILCVADPNTAQVRALDRARTVVMRPGGMLEEHGPHLPAFTDSILSGRLTQDLDAKERDWLRLNQLRPAGRDIEELVQQALEDRARAGDIPDIAMLSDARRIAVRQELPLAGLTLGPGALPRIDGYEFHLLSASAAQAEADRTKKNVPFISVDRASISGDDATIWIGADFAAPSDPATVKMCCCEGEARFRKNAGRWVFVAWRLTRCS